MKKDFSAYRAEAGILPLVDVYSIRLSRLQTKHIKANAALLGATPSDLIRFFMQKGAERYGINLNGML